MSYCLQNSHEEKYCKGCLPQILLGPLLNTFSQMSSIPLYYFILFPGENKENTFS